MAKRKEEQSLSGAVRLLVDDLFGLSTKTLEVRLSVIRLIDVHNFTGENPENIYRALMETKSRLRTIEGTLDDLTEELNNLSLGQH